MITAIAVLQLGALLIVLGMLANASRGAGENGRKVEPPARTARRVAGEPAPSTRAYVKHDRRQAQMRAVAMRRFQEADARIQRAMREQDMED